MVDFSPLLENAFDPLQVLKAYGTAQTQKIATLKAERDVQTRTGVQQRLAVKDYGGARTTALSGGDTGLADAIGKLSDDERKSAEAGTQAFGSAAYGLRQTPQAQRAQAFDQGVGALQGIIPPEQLAQARAHLEQSGWSDQAVDGYINAATTVKDLLAAQPKPTSAMQNLAAANIRPDDPRYAEALLGNVNPSQFMEFGSDATGRKLIQTRGMGAGGVPASAPAQGGGAPAGPAIETAMLGAMPGTRVSSRQRSAAHNAEVGGASGSAHLTDDGRDFVPPQGVSMDQLAATARQQFPGMYIANEGDHVHVGLPKGQRSAGDGPRVVAQTAPVASAGEGYHLLTPQEAQAQNLDPNVRYQQSAKGQITALGGQSRAQLKSPPPKAVSDVTDSRDIIRQVDQALAAIGTRPKSIGPGTGMLGDTYTQINDPGGTTTRAVIGKIAGKVIHDVSGAAVTLSEEPRFKPYVPTVSDTPQVARDKLLQMRRIASALQDDALNYYSEENGYRPMAFGKRAPPPLPKASLPAGWSVKKVR